MAGGRVCEFFLQGRCRFGDNCKNIHPREQAQQNRFAPLSNQPSSSSGGRARSGGVNGGDRHRPGQDEKLPYYLNHDALRADLTIGGTEGEKPEWPLSAYGPGKEAPRQLLEGLIEQSFEEARVLCYAAVNGNNLQEYIQKEAEAKNQANQQAQNILGDLDGAIKYIVDGENQHPNRNDHVIKNAGSFRGTGQIASTGGNSAPGQPSAASGSSAFGQPSQPGRGSGFGQASQMGSGSAFGQPSQAGSGSAFGQSSQLGGSSSFGQASSIVAKPAFGQPTQSAAVSAFGQASAVGGGGGGGSFGQPSALGAKPTFGQPTQPAFGQSAFGQAAKPAFGQTPSPFGQQQQQQPQERKPNPFASQASQPSGFAAAAAQPSAFGQTGQMQQQQPSPFGQASGASQSSGFVTSGSQAGTNPFAASKPASTPAFDQPTQANGSAFGQPSQLGNSVFGQPSQPFGGSATPAPASNANSNGSAFGQPTQPASGSTGIFGARPNGAAAAPTQASASSQPNGTATGISATATYTSRTANGTLQAWKGRQVMYDEHNNPTYGNPQTGKMERIWHANGPPETPNAYAEAPPELYVGELGALLKEVYDYVRQDEQFKDGVMPEIPPKREWLRWDL
ncbi:hypothetical protein LTR36_007591 [Oleoguttula mirabilis]|uniref:C3H1-type domain-containing protein n=1 Tax=Oleoguttula mirabilis TaxID=1507867 RepID=A0AAV9JWY8_9PEZI|nr:hypothetical protein LTR36_007591 [Oleoguttula mirabilis]